MTWSDWKWELECFAVWAVAVIGGLFFGGVIWVAVHFIIKFW